MRMAFLLGSLDGGLAEFLELLHQLQGGLAGACAGGLVAFLDLGGGILLEGLEAGVDGFDEILHDAFVFKRLNKK